MRPLLFSLLLAAVAGADALDDALAKAGLRRQDLGWRPRGYWSRFPMDIPHKLRHFDDCLAEPLAVVNVSRTMGNSLRANLDPAALAKPAEKSDGALYKAAFALGVERRIGSFRGYSTNLTAKDTDVVEALLAVQRDAGRPDRLVTFGQESPYPDYRKDLEKAAAAIPAAARPILGRLVLNALDARHWAALALRNVPLEKRAAACARLDLGVENTDALDYAPAVDDVARAWDEPSMWYAGLKAVQALDEARLALAKLEAAPAFAFDWRTPYGWVRIRGGGDDTVDAAESFVIVDLGGKDAWKGPAGANDALRLVALALDCGGDDAYEAEGPAQGAGLCGVGVLLDASGNDTYRAGECAQGFGQLGMGVLADLGGKDAYAVKFQGQGAAILGVGELLESGGDDTYAVWCHGQGYGAAGGVGVLADRAGNDAYVAERDPGLTGRPSYHSELKVSVSEAQGVGMGRRGDGADGHSWAGGLGALLDASGDDTYSAGNWCMGTGYWFGTGILWDGGGNDSYAGGVWSEATGAHFCIGALVDESGDDRHVAVGRAVNAVGFAHDFTVSVFVDAAGNDVYESANGPGTSINRSFALFLDLGGDDAYSMSEKNRPGTAVFDERFRDRSGGATYFADASSLGLFLDAGGRDTYVPELANDSSWLDDPGSPNPSVRNWSVGVDRADGTVNLDPAPEKDPRK